MLLVGIGGGTASGKSTLARALANRLGARGLFIAHDRYYRTLPEGFRGRELDYNFDHPDALDNDLLAENLSALARGESVRLPDYDFSLCQRTDPDSWQTADPMNVDVVVVEGILVLAVEALRTQFNRRFFVHTPADIRLARRLARDIVERGDTVEGVLAQYMATVRPMHEAFVEPSRIYAEQVFDGTIDPEVTVEQLLTTLR